MNQKLNERFKHIVTLDQKSPNSLKVIRDSPSNSECGPDAMSMGDPLDDSLELAMLEHTLEPH